MNAAEAIIGIGHLKKCTVCGELKLLCEFCRDKQNKDGHRSCCKLCDNEAHRRRRAKNPEKARERYRKWRSANPEKARENAKRYRVENSKRARECTRRWRVANPEKAREYDRKRRAVNPEKARERHRRWRAANPEKVRETDKKHRSTPRGALRNAISSAMNCSLNNGSKAGRRWETLVGYTVDDLKKHLERKFQPGMSWDNYGQWHVDHIIPVSVFNFETPEDIDFKRCWELKNLQPMWAKDNIIKSNKLDKPFQPSLLIRQNEKL